jgi:hypothetical protein
MHVPGEPQPPSIPTGRAKISWWLAGLGFFLCCGVPGLIGMSIYTFFSDGKHQVKNFVCLQNLRSVAAAQAMYSVDNMGKLPPATWMDATLPYLKKDVGAIGCPSVRNEKREEYGLAMNESVVGKMMGSLGDLGNTPLIFDSALLHRNAVGDISTLPNPGRHNKPSADEQYTREGNHVAFVDGSARWTHERKF